MREEARGAKSTKCSCAICALQIAFDLDSHLLSEIEKHNCAIFAGAGISTEAQFAHPDTLYEALKAEVGGSENLSFPAVVLSGLPGRQETDQ